MVGKTWGRRGDALPTWQYERLPNRSPDCPIAAPLLANGGLLRFGTPTRQSHNIRESLSNTCYVVVRSKYIHNPYFFYFATYYNGRSEAMVET
jgi:hypothetical protein